MGWDERKTRCRVGAGEDEEEDGGEHEDVEKKKKKPVPGNRESERRGLQPGIICEPGPKPDGDESPGRDSPPFWPYVLFGYVLAMAVDAKCRAQSVLVRRRARVCTSLHWCKLESAVAAEEREEASSSQVKGGKARQWKGRRPRSGWVGREGAERGPTSVCVASARLRHCSDALPQCLTPLPQSSIRAQQKYLTKTGKTALPEAWLGFGCSVLKLVLAPAEAKATQSKAKRLRWPSALLRGFSLQVVRALAT